MGPSFNFWVNFDDIPFWTYEKRDSMDAVKDPTHKGFFGPYSEGIHEFFISICNERKGKVVLCSEFFMRCLCVAANPYNRNASSLKLFEEISEPAGFFCAPGSTVSRVKVDQIGFSQ